MLVVGGGPVGLATAIHARLAGMEVAVFDRAHPPIDKACGEGLMPGGVAILRALGVELDPDGCSPFRGIRYLDGGVVAEGLFPDGPGLGVRRLHLHRGMVARAEALGVELRWGTEVTGLTAAGLQHAGGEERGGLIVGADGLRSRVRALAGLEGPRRGLWERFGVRQHFRVKPWTDLVEVHWADGCEAYVTPVGPERVGVAFLLSGMRARFPEMLARFPALAKRLEGAEADSQVRGLGPLAQRAGAVLRPGPVPVALVGDASGYRDAITGEGLSLGFHGAKAVIDLAAGGQLERWPRLHRRMVRMPFALIDLLLWVERSPWLRRRVVGALAREPEVFGRMLAVNDGAPIGSLGVDGLLRLGLGLLRGAEAAKERLA